MMVEDVLYGVKECLQAYVGNPCDIALILSGGPDQPKTMKMSMLKFLWTMEEFNYMFWKCMDMSEIKVSHVVYVELAYITLKPEFFN